MCRIRPFTCGAGDGPVVRGSPGRGVARVPAQTKTPGRRPARASAAGSELVLRVVDGRHRWRHGRVPGVVSSSRSRRVSALGAPSTASSGSDTAARLSSAARMTLPADTRAVATMSSPSKSDLLLQATTVASIAPSGYAGRAQAASPARAVGRVRLPTRWSPARYASVAVRQSSTLKSGYTFSGCCVRTPVTANCGRWSTRPSASSSPSFLPERTRSRSAHRAHCVGR